MPVSREERDVCPANEQMGVWAGVPTQSQGHGHRASPPVKPPSTPTPLPQAPPLPNKDTLIEYPEKGRINFATGTKKGVFGDVCVGKKTKELQKLL